MNQHLKDILKVAGNIAISSASTAIPGAGVIISGVTKLIDHDRTNNFDALVDLENGIATALNNLSGDEVVNPTLMNKGIADARLAFEEIRAALKK